MLDPPSVSTFLCSGACVVLSNIVDRCYIVSPPHTTQHHWTWLYNVGWSSVKYVQSVYSWPVGCVPCAHFIKLLQRCHRFHSALCTVQQRLSMAADHKFHSLCYTPVVESAKSVPLLQQRSCSTNNRNDAELTHQANITYSNKYLYLYPVWLREMLQHIS